MANGKKPSAPAASRLRKMHGPKRHMFKEFKPLIRTLASDGVLSKYYAFESWVLACQARGVKAPRREDFNKFIALKTIKEKDEWFANLKNS